MSKMPNNQSMKYPETIYADTDLVCGEEPKEGHAKYIRADLATPAPAAMTPDVRTLVEAAWQMLIEYDEANIEPEPRSMTSAAIRLRAALAALLGVPVALLAAIGYVAVFAGAANTP